MCDDIKKIERNVGNRNTTVLLFLRQASKKFLEFYFLQYNTKMPLSKLTPNLQNLLLRSGHPVYHRESTHRYFHRPFRERNRKDEEEEEEGGEEEEEEVKGSRDATSRSRDVYIASTHAAAREREGTGGNDAERGEPKGGTKMVPPFFP